MSMTEQPNPTFTNSTTSPATTPPQLQQQHHDEDPELFALRSQAVQKPHTCPVPGQSRGRSSNEKTSRTQRPSYVAQHAVYQSILKWTMMWYTQYAAYQDKRPSVPVPVCTDSTSVREPVETEPNLSQPPTLSSYSVSRYSHEPSALNIQPDFRCFSWCHDPITHAHGPEAQHMLDPSSMSVVIVIVIVIFIVIVFVSFLTTPLLLRTCGHTPTPGNHDPETTSASAKK